MIHLSILRHIRRLIASAIIFGSAVLLMLWLPIQILKFMAPKFLPYTLSGDSEVNELSLQLLLLQVNFIIGILIRFLIMHFLVYFRLFCQDSLNNPKHVFGLRV